MTLYSLFNRKCPRGWEQLSTDDGRYLYVKDADPLQEAGATTKSHTHTASLTPVGHCASAIPSNCFQGYELTSIDIQPAGIKQVFCKVKNVRAFPTNAILISDDTSCPEGWSEYATGDSQYVLFTETEAEGGDATAGAKGNHRHQQTGSHEGFNTSNGPTKLAYTTYTDIIDNYTDLYHIKMMLCKKD